MAIDPTVFFAWLAAGLACDFLADQYVGRRVRAALVLFWAGIALLAGAVAAAGLEPPVMMTAGVAVPLLGRWIAGLLLRPWSRDVYRQAARRLVREYGEP